MNQSQALLFLNQSCHEAVEWMTSRLNQSGFQVIQTFDFENTRETLTSCNCTHRRNERCDCQMVVLLVYGNSVQPISLIAHGYDGKTWLSLVNTFHAGSPSLETRVRDVLTRLENNVENNEPSFA